MRHMRSRKGQSTAEYAVLFAIVIGAAIGIQQYVKTRLQGAVQGASDGYMNAVNGGGLTWTAFNSTASLSSGQAGVDTRMNGAKSGVVNSLAGSDSGFNKLR